jgi:hypothetical protein
MKHRILALVCALLLMVQMGFVPALAARPVYFTAINANVLPLTDESMPFWSGGYLYVDSSIFTMADNTPGKLLGIYRSLNTAKQVLVLSADGRSLIFDLVMETVQDDQGISYYPASIQRNGRVFIPVSLVAYFFSLTYSSTRVDREGSYHGYLVRIRNDKTAIPDDKNFADAATYLMETRYADYLKGKEPEETPMETPSDDPAEEITIQQGKTVYLCLKASDAVAVEGLLDVLDRNGGQVVFYCTLDFLEEQGDLLRRMEATGQGIGLLADAGNQELSVLEQLEQGNRALERATCRKTRLAFLEDVTEQAKAEAENAGYCCLKAALDRSAYPLKSASAADTLLQRVTGQKGTASVWLGDSADEAGLRAFLVAAAKADNRCLALTETV